MSLLIEPYSAAYASEIARLNSRLEAANVEPWIRLSAGGPDERLAFDSEPVEPFSRRHYLVIDRGEVRGGFILQEQAFEVAGRRRWVANIQTPISEGVVDRRHALVAPKMMSMILARNPLVFAVGMGGSLNQPSARLIAGMRWPMTAVPFAFCVLNPVRFLTQIRSGRHAAGRTALARVAAWSGVGWLGFRSLRAARDLRRRVSSVSKRAFSAERITAWGTWADAIWDDYRTGCSFAAVRDSRTLPYLHPLNRPGCESYRFCGDDGLLVGWVALRLRAMQQNRYFGNMQVATVLDAVARPGWEQSVLRAVVDLASRAGSDVIVSNQHHQKWRHAQRCAGFLEWRSNYLLALSPQLAAAMEPLAESYDRAHVTRGDGDGRVNL